jgi:hypothetical protein
MKIRLFVAVLAVVLVLLQSGCQMPPATPTSLPGPGSMPARPGNEPAAVPVTIERVEITSASGRITFSGQSTLPDGACLLSELLGNGKPLEWWPMEQCIQVAGGAWSVTVTLPPQGGKGALQANTGYELHVAEKGATASAVFWFDLNGPRNPGR